MGGNVMYMVDIRNADSILAVKPLNIRPIGRPPTYKWKYIKINHRITH
jgi:hypothetical protein